MTIRNSPSRTRRIPTAASVSPVVSDYFAEFVTPIPDTTWRALRLNDAVPRTVARIRLRHHGLPHRGFSGYMASESPYAPGHPAWAGRIQHPNGVIAL
jgi:hypothetical protein